jgi:tetratricopeptide (TPR) repeat protein
MKIKNMIIGILCLVTFLMLSAEDPVQSNIVEGKQSLKKGYNYWNVESMKTGRDMLLSADKMAKNNVSVHYHIGYANYLLTIYYLKNDKDQAKSYLKEAKSFLEQAIKNGSNSMKAEAYALLATVLGVEIGLVEPAETPAVAMKINEYLFKAISLAEKNPRVNYLKGINLMHTPEQWGGSPDKAIDFFKKAIEFFKTKPKPMPTDPDWGEDEVYYYCGLTYHKKGDVQKAEEYLNQSLKINPEFGLARITLAEWKIAASKKKNPQE